MREVKEWFAKKLVSRLIVCLLCMSLYWACQPPSITGAEYLVNGPRIGKITVVNVSDEVRFEPKTAVLAVADSVPEAIPVLNKIIEHMTTTPEARLEVKVSHVHRKKAYRREGLLKSKTLKEYLVSRGIRPERITTSTFLDRRSKYPYNSDFRKVLLVIESIP